MLAIGLTSISAAHAWTAAEVDFPGDWNGWSLDCPTFKYNGPDGISEWFRMYAVLGANVNPFNFKMVTGNDFNQDYGGNLTFANNTWDIIYYDPLSDTASLLVGGGQAGKRYIFTVRDPGLANTFIAIQEISANPIEITSVSGGTGYGFATGLAVEVKITLSAQPSPEEKACVRYSYNNFATYGIATSSIAVVTATNINQGGTNFVDSWIATARFTPTVGNTNYKWYAFTTTASSHVLEGAGGLGVDALTLDWDNNGGQNFALYAHAASLSSHIDALAAPGVTNMTITMTYAGSTTRTTTIQSASSLVPTDWQPLTSFPSQTGTTYIVIPIDITNDALFIRLSTDL